MKKNSKKSQMQGIGKTQFIYILVFLVTVAFSSCNVSKENSGKADSNAWGHMGIGGGGAMFYPAVSPHNPDFVFVSCDMTGSYVTYNGGESWRAFNLRGVTSSYIFDPIDSNTVYANSVMLYKSTDRGQTWDVIYPSPDDIERVISKGDHAQEVVVTKDKVRRRVLALAVDPENSEKLFAVISIAGTPVFHHSEDGGKNWVKEEELKEGSKNIYIVPSSPIDNRTIYVTGNTSITEKQNGVWKTNAAPLGTNKMIEFAGGYDKGSDKFVIYGIAGESYFDPEGKASGIFYTEDGGKTWENREGGLTKFSMEGSKLPEWRGIATSSLNPGTVYISYDRLKADSNTTFIGVAKSEDYGKTWDLSWKDVLRPGGNTASENFTSGWLNDRFGPTWGENPFSIGVSPVNPNVVYTTDFGRTVKTTNGGKTWEQVYTNKKQDGGWYSRGLEVTTGYQVVFDPFDVNNVFISTTDIGLTKSKDGGESWLSATHNNGIPRGWQNSTYWLTFDPEVKGRAWAAMSGSHDLPRPKMWRRGGTSGYKGGIVVTNDGGETWEPLSLNDIGEGAATHVLIDPTSNKDSRTLLASVFGKGVYKSIDGGKSWEKKNKGIEGDEPFAWRIVRKETDGTLFLIVSRRSDDGSIGNEGDGALYRSEDNGESWIKMALPAETNGPTSLIVDSNNPSRLLLSAWGRNMKGEFTPDIGGGMFASDDDGKSWTQVYEKDQHIHDITFDPRINTYYASGFNSSAYKSIDQGKTWSRIKGYNFKWGKRVDLDPRDANKIFVITYGGGVWTGSANGDEEAIEDIVTPVAAYGAAK